MIKSARQNVKRWWISVLVGVVAVVLGVWCLTTPLNTLVALSLVFAISFFIDGILDIVLAISSREVMRGWGWNLVGGIISIIFGIILVGLPLVTITVVLLYFIAFWVMFSSIMGIGTSIELQRLGIRGWGWVLAFAILGILASILLIISPSFTAGFVVFLVAFSIISYGISRIIIGIRLRSINKEISKYME